MASSQAPLTPDPFRTPDPAPVPAATPAPEPETDKVTFTEAQQSKLDEIIKAAQGRTARELRTKLLETEATNATLRQQLEVAARANAPDATAEERHAAELQQRDLRIKELEQDRQRTARENAIKAVAKAENFCDDADALRFVDLPDDADATTIATAVRAVAAQKPHLIKSSVKSGSGSGVADRPVAVDYRLEELFGPKSNSRAANQLAISDRAKYQRLRAEAVRKGLL